MVRGKGLGQEKGPAKGQVTPGQQPLPVVG